MTYNSPATFALTLLLLTAANATQAENLSPTSAAAPCRGNVGHMPFAIGSKQEIGTVSTIEKAAGGLLGGGMQSIFGGGLSVGDTGNGNGSDPADDLQIVKSPIRDFQTFKIPNSEILIDVGAMINTDGKLLVSSKIKNAPGKGTFHNINLHNMGCQQMSPIRYYTYGVYRDWSLQVMYTHTSEHYQNGSLINREVESTGWKEIASGTERTGRINISFVEKLGSDDVFYKKTIDGKVIDQGVWKRHGFNRATDGINWVGSEFDTTAMDFDKPLALSISITSPKQDPVLAIPLNLLTYKQADGNVKLVDINREDGASTVVMGVPISREAFNRWVEAGANSDEKSQQRADEVKNSWEQDMVSSMIQQWSPAWNKSTAVTGEDKTATKDAGDAFMDAFGKAFGGGEFFKFEYLGPEPDIEDSPDLDDDLVTFRYKVHF